MFAWTVRTMNTISSAAITIRTMPTAVSMSHSLRPVDWLVVAWAGWHDALVGGATAR